VEGNVLDGQMHNATIELQALRTFKMQLPQNRDFDSAT
jgi:alpha-acetolactate decarboxylase